MKRNLLKCLFTPALALSLQTLFAGGPAVTVTTDNFNSRPGVKLSEVKGHLQGNCWFFADFDVNRSGWAPNMEGDGAMVSGTGASATERTGIYTPLLDLSSEVPVSFIYSFNRSVTDRRWIKLYATDANGNILSLLDSLELTGAGSNKTYAYAKSLPIAAAGQYKLYINYQGIGGDARIAIDKLSIGAAPHYQSTCNVSPVALKDKFSGTASHTANGNVLSNDYDPNHEMMTAYLLSESPDGRVELQKDGGFTFTPKDGFTGNSTQFAYKVCDNGSPSLCSITTTATIKFPSKSTLTGFQALYSRKEVAISWNKASDNHSTRFELERSLDGAYFRTVGEVKAEDAVQEYSFVDKMTEATRKNDIYYRLRQVDGSNRVTYSKVLILRSYGSKSVEAVSVTPDPNVNDIQVNVQLKEKSFVMVKVTDEKGSELIKQSAMGENGSNMYNIEGTSELKPGMYQLDVIINSNERLTMKLAKS
ncbi:MAG: cadherin-like domain-containing protein [Bacteroidetes bacterium]|nr:cadherin-like domain-containing protein [Bacteroidota bacterium]